MKTSEKCEKLHGQLFKALQEIPVMPKNAKGYGYTYTTLDTIVETVKPILFKNNLCFMQSIDDNSITTRIFNEQGEYIESSSTLPDVEIAKANKAQNVGASITYLRRYSLCAMLGIVSDDDTDGVPPSSKLPASYQQVKSEPRPKEATPDPDLKELGNILNSTNNGKPVFTEEEKQMYRDKVEKGEFKKKLIEDAKVQLQEKLTGGQKEQLPIF